MKTLDLKALAASAAVATQEANDQARREREAAVAEARRVEAAVVAAYDKALETLENKFAAAVKKHELHLVIHRWVDEGERAREVNKAAEDRLASYFLDLGVQTGTAGGLGPGDRGESEFYVDIPSLLKALPAAK